MQAICVLFSWIYLLGRLAEGDSPVATESYFKITKAGIDITYYLKENNLVRVNGDKSFYVYSLTVDSNSCTNKECSAWNGITAEEGKSGLCKDDGSFEGCTKAENARRERILGVECIKTTFATLTITKKTANNEDSYELATTGDNSDLKDYTVTALSESNKSGIYNNLNIKIK